MAQGGYIKLYRSLFSHEFFRSGKFSERESFTWMIAEAAWKPRSRRMGQFFVELERGELAASLRFLGETWGWEVGAVRRFLSRCENEQMIGTRTDKGITIVNICNYDVYQGDDPPDDTVVTREPANDRQGTGTEAAKSRHKTEELKNIEERKEGEEITDADEPGLFGGDNLPAVQKEPPPDFDGMFERWYEAYPKHVDPKDAKPRFIRVLKNREATFDELMAGAQRYRQECEMDRTPKRFIKAPSVFLNKGSWKNEAGAHASGNGVPRRAESTMEGMMDFLSTGGDDGEQGS